MDKIEYIQLMSVTPHMSKAERKHYMATRQELEQCGVNVAEVQAQYRHYLDLQREVEELRNQLRELREQGTGTK